MRIYSLEITNHDWGQRLVAQGDHKDWFSVCWLVHRYCACDN